MVSEIGELVTKLRVAQGERDLLGGRYDDKVDEVDVVRDELKERVTEALMDLIQSNFGIEIPKIEEASAGSYVASTRYTHDYMKLWEFASMIVRYLELEE